MQQQHTAYDRLRHPSIAYDCCCYLDSRFPLARISLHDGSTLCIVRGDTHLHDIIFRLDAQLLIDLVLHGETMTCMDMHIESNIRTQYAWQQRACTCAATSAHGRTTGHKTHMRICGNAMHAQVRVHAHNGFEHVRTVPSESTRDMMSGLMCITCDDILCIHVTCDMRTMQHTRHASMHDQHVCMHTRHTCATCRCACSP